MSVAASFQEEMIRVDFDVYNLLVRDAKTELDRMTQDPFWKTYTSQLQVQTDDEMVKQNAVMVCSIALKYIRFIREPNESTQGKVFERVVAKLLTDYPLQRVTFGGNGFRVNPALRALFGIFHDQSTAQIAETMIRTGFLEEKVVRV